MGIPCLGTFDHKLGRGTTMKEAERYMKEIHTMIPGTLLDKTIGLFDTPQGRVLGYPDDAGKSLHVVAWIGEERAPEENADGNL